MLGYYYIIFWGNLNNYTKYFSDPPPPPTGPLPTPGKFITLCKKSTCFKGPILSVKNRGNNRNLSVITLKYRSCS